MVDVKKILIFSISGDEGPAKFEAVYEREITKGEDYREVIEEMARKDEFLASDEKWSDNLRKDLRDASKKHIHSGVASQDGLNIRLGKGDGPVAIAIRLPKRGPSNQLVFHGNPILEQRTNSGTGETFIASDHRHNSGGRRWASFVCDPKKASEGKLAKYVRNLPSRFSNHQGEMRVPFSYNIVDERLRFAPWVLTDHAHVEKDQAQTRAGGDSMLTHGGVHPNFSYYLTIAL